MSEREGKGKGEVRDYCNMSGGMMGGGKETWLDWSRCQIHLQHLGVGFQAWCRYATIMTGKMEDL